MRTGTDASRYAAPAAGAAGGFDHAMSFAAFEKLNRRTDAAERKRGVPWRRQSHSIEDLMRQRLVVHDGKRDGIIDLRVIFDDAGGDAIHGDLRKAISKEHTFAAETFGGFAPCLLIEGILMPSRRLSTRILVPAERASHRQKVQTFQCQSIRQHKSIGG